MPTPSGQIAFSQVNAELGVSPTSSQANLGSAPFRGLAGVPSGQISMSNLQNKSSFAVTGGTTFTPGDGYRYFVFTSTGPLLVTGSGNIHYVAIGGGAGGGNAGPGPSDAGGGGAGGYVTAPLNVTGPFNITVTIGAGGLANTPGNNTTIAFPAPNGGTITAGGGGAGANGGAFNGTPAPLGSGGGGSHMGPTLGGTGGPQGNPGGQGSTSGGGGGGGAGGAGGAGAVPPSPTDGGTGGLSIQLSAPYRNIPGIGYPGPSGTHWFAGGGSGSDGGSVQGGGAGGEGAPALSAQVNSGSGGGGRGTFPGGGGTGGSGIVIIRQLI